MHVLKLPFGVKKEILACGADIKASFCFARDSRAYFTNGFGDLSDINNMEKYEAAVRTVGHKFELRPEIVACDLHPEYFSTRFGQNYAIRYSLSAIRHIQHHHAHIASCIVDNDIKGKVIGVGFDGAGFGADGRIWGGEFLLADLKSFKRAAYFDYVPMPGGDVAARETWRMAFSYLYNIYGNSVFRQDIPFLKRAGIKKCKILVRMINKNINSPLTSSMGRLFDGVSSLAGIKNIAAFEGEAAIELEKRADPDCRDKYGYSIKNKDGCLVIETGHIVRDIVGDIKRKEAAGVISSKFHNTIAYIVKDAACRISKRENIGKIVFSGGVFQNKYLVRRIIELFKETDLNIHFHRNIPTTDAGLALGQIAIANASVRIR